MFPVRATVHWNEHRERGYGFRYSGYAIAEYMELEDEAGKEGVGYCYSDVRRLVGGIFVIVTIREKADRND